MTYVNTNNHTTSYVDKTIHVEHQHVCFRSYFKIGGTSRYIYIHTYIHIHIHVAYSKLTYAHVSHMARLEPGGEADRDVRASYLSDTASFVSCVFRRRVKGHHDLLHYSQLLKKTGIRQVVLDKCFPLSLDCLWGGGPQCPRWLAEGRLSRLLQLEPCGKSIMITITIIIILRLITNNTNEC